MATTAAEEHHKFGFLRQLACLLSCCLVFGLIRYFIDTEFHASKILIIKMQTDEGERKE